MDLYPRFCFRVRKPSITGNTILFICKTKFSVSERNPKKENLTFPWIDDGWLAKKTGPVTGILNLKDDRTWNDVQASNKVPCLIVSHWKDTRNVRVVLFKCLTWLVVLLSVDHSPLLIYSWEGDHVSWAGPTGGLWFPQDAPARITSCHPSTSPIHRFTNKIPLPFVQLSREIIPSASEIIIRL